MSASTQPGAPVRTSLPQRICGLLERLAEITGGLVAWLTLAMVIVTCVVVALRYLFDTGFIWMQESVVWMHALVFLLAAAYTLQRDEHVRVDVFYRRLDARGRALVNLLGTLLLLVPTVLFLLVTSLSFVAQSWRVAESSAEAGGLPALYLLKTAIPVAMVLLLLQAVVITLRSLAVLLGTSEKPPAPGAGKGGGL